MKRIYLVRHGETDLNVSGVFYGHTDCDLNGKGETQAMEVAMALKDIQFRKVISSPLKRARRTADIILGENWATEKADLVLDDRLKEINFGEWEGLSYEEISKRDPVFWENYMKTWPENPSPGGESFRALFGRIRGFFEELDDSEVEGNILITAHHGSVGLLLVHALGLDIRDYWKFRIDQGVYSVMSKEAGHYVLEKINTRG